MLNLWKEEQQQQQMAVARAAMDMETAQQAKSAKIVPRSERRGSVLRREALERFRQGKSGAPRGEDVGDPHEAEAQGRSALESHATREGESLTSF